MYDVCWWLLFSLFDCLVVCRVLRLLVRNVVVCVCVGGSGLLLLVSFVGWWF